MKKIFEGVKITQVHIYDEKYDRFIYFEHDENNSLIGFNFMQSDGGDGEYELFVNEYCYNKKEMFNQYIDFKKSFNHLLIDDEYKIVNEFFWYYVSKFE